MGRPLCIVSSLSCPETLLRLLQCFINSQNQVKQIHSLLLTSGYFLKESQKPKILFTLKWKATNIYNTLIRSYLNMGQYHNTLALFTHMLAHKVHPNNLTFSSLIKAASSSSSLISISGTALHSQALKWGVLLDPFVQTSFLRLYGEIGDLGSAYKMFDEIYHPCIVACNAMLDAFGRNGDMNSALLLFECMNKKDVISWTSIINGFAKNGCFDEAIKYFLGMMEHIDVLGGRIKPNEVTLVSVLSSCANADRGLHLGKQIHGYIFRSEINLSSFLGTSLVDIYGKAGHLEMAIRVFNQTEAKKVCTWNAVISALACNGKEWQAIYMFEQMKMQAFQPNDVTLVAVLAACARARLLDLGACKIQGETQLGNEVGKRLLQLQPRHCGQYVALSNINAVMERWEHAAESRKVMIESGVRKIPGYSLVYTT